MRPIKMFPLLMVLYEVSTYLSNDMYLPALPQMTRDLNITQHLAQLTLATWFLGMAATPLIVGPLSDRYGRRPIFLWGGLLFVVSTIVCVVTANPTMLLITRFLEGAAVGTVLVAGYAAIHELYEQKEAIRVLAWMGSVTILAPAFGPLFGGFVLQFANWRFIFWILAVWSAITLLALLKWMPESHPPEKRHLFSMRILLNQYCAILMNKVFILNTLIFCFTFGGIIAWIAMGPFLSIDVFHYSTLMFGVFQIPLFGSFMLGARLVKYGLKKLGILKLILLGLIIEFCGAALSVLFAAFLPEYFICFLAALAIFIGGAALAFGPLERIAIEASPEPMGSRMAIFSSLMSWFGVLGSFAASIFYDGSSLVLGYIVLLSVVFACFVRLWLVKPIKE